jgi:hypothetical protein
MLETTDTATPTTPAPDAAESQEPERALVSLRALARGSQLELKNALVGGALGERITVTRALVRAAVGARSVELHQAGAGVIATAGGASIQQGGAQAVVSAGPVTMRQAGSGFAIGRSVTVENGLVIFGIAPRIDVAEGSRVIFGPLASLAIIGSVAALAGIAAILVRAGRGRTT